MLKNEQIASIQGQLTKKFQLTNSYFMLFLVNVQQIASICYVYLPEAQKKHNKTPWVSPTNWSPPTPSACRSSSQSPMPRHSPAETWQNGEFGQEKWCKNWHAKEKMVGHLGFQWFSIIKTGDIQPLNLKTYKLLIRKNNRQWECSATHIETRESRISNSYDSYLSYPWSDSDMNQWYTNLITPENRKLW